MKTLQLQDCRITLDCAGAKKYAKVSYPIRYGRYAEIKQGDFLYQFNLAGEIKHITGTGSDWPHPAEWLKRTMGNDWVYYSTGSYYAGVIDLFGEYYLPCPAYATNTLFKEKPFARQGVAEALRAFNRLSPFVPGLRRNIKGREHEGFRDFLDLVGRAAPEKLALKADRLHRILKARVSVLPPDCRHVDYDVIPLMITDGCMYNCSFCEVKSGTDLSCRSRHEIREQCRALREFFGPDLLNYNSVYLGQHDALAAHPAVILFAAEEAYAILEIKKSYLQEPRLFLFGSAESFLHQKEHFWNSLNRLPFYTYVNLGLESFDDETLKCIRKPASYKVMLEAFRQMLAINKGYENIEITANFILGENLPDSHMPALVAQVGDAAEGGAGKGCIYISPLKGSGNTIELFNQFRTVKQRSRLQTFLYLIQRL